jgi:hypothetical protein
MSASRQRLGRSWARALVDCAPLGVTPVSPKRNSAAFRVKDLICRMGLIKKELDFAEKLETMLLQEK